VTSPVFDDPNLASFGGTLCSTPGASTASSPPPTQPRSTPWPRTRLTAVTRPSNRSTPPWRTPRWRTCLQHRSPRTRPGSCWPWWRNLTRAAATITGPGLAKATTAAIRRKLIAVPARVASSARRMTLHLLAGWPWETAWSDLLTRASGPPPEPRNW